MIDARSKVIFGIRKEVFMRCWIIIADAAKARVFSVRGDRSLELVEQRKHPLSRARTHDLGSAQPGRIRKGKGSQTRSAMEPRTDAHDVELNQFATEIADTLQTARLRGEYDELAIIAPPRFLGLLRKEIDPKTAACVRSFTASDLTRESARILEKGLATSLETWFTSLGHKPTPKQRRTRSPKQAPSDEHHLELSGV
jgi:protein required for attachment to host cells